MAKHRSLKSLSNKLSKIALAVEGNSVIVAKRATFAGLNAAVLSTPVDEGAARSNWNVSVKTPDETTIKPPHAKGEKLGVGESQNANAAIAEGADKINKYKFLDRKLFIANNLKYIRYLDEGSSDQAPEGMTKFALNAIRQVVNKSRLLKGNLKDAN